MRTVVSLVLAVFLAAAVPAASTAKPIDAGPASTGTPAAVQTCYQPSAIAHGMIGALEGEICRWDGPNGQRRLQIVEISGRLSARAFEPVAEWSTVARRTEAPSVESSRERMSLAPSAGLVPAVA